MITSERPAIASRPRNFVTVAELRPGELRSLLDLTGRVKRDPDVIRGRLAGRRVGMLLDKPSTRTRVSFESAAWALGMLPIVLHPDELQLGRGESVGDTARALSLYLDALAVRTSKHSRLQALAEAATVPVLGHPAVVVDDFAATFSALEEAGHEVERHRELWGEPRAFVVIPGGHRVEFMAAPPPPEKGST